MVNLGGASPLNLAQESKKAIDYWRRYKDEQIRIEYTQLQVPEASPQDIIKTTHGITGVVSKVMALPPGFLLQDAEYFVNPENQSIEPVPQGGAYTEHKGEMFVSFDSIENIVFEDDET